MKWLLFPLLFFVPLLPAVAAVKLAVIGADDAKDAVAVVIADLSKVDGLEVLERDKIEAVLRENKLTQGDLDPLRIGQLLSADGVLVVEKAPTNYSVRLVAVGPGVVLGSALFENKLESLGESVAARFTSIWPKLTLKPGTAIPVSILNLRNNLPGKENFETQVTFLLGHYLAQYPEIIVLERREMSELSWEKGLSNTEVEFRKASYLIEGSFEIKSTGEAMASISLNRPGAAVDSTIGVGGTELDPAALAKDLAAAIAQSFKAGDPAEYDGLAERGAFAKEAKWAFKARLYKAAKSALEAATALGNKDPNLAELRVLIDSALAFPPGARPPKSGGVPPSPDYPSPKGYQKDTIDVRTGNAHLRSAFDSLASFQTYLKEPGEKKKAERIGSTAVLAASRVLRAYYDAGILASHISELAELQQSLLQAVASMEALGDRGRNKNEVHFVDEIGAVYIPFWHSKPADTLAAFRRILALQSGSPGNLRFTLALKPKAPNWVDDAADTPWLVPWQGESNDELTAIWSDFLNQLEKSEIIQEKLDGAFLRMVNSAPPEKLNAKANLRERIWESREEVLKLNLAPTYLARLSENSVSNLEDQKRWLAFYLEAGTTYNSSILNYAWRVDKLDDAEAAALLDRWRRFKTRLAIAGQMSRYDDADAAKRETDLFLKHPGLNDLSKPKGMLNVKHCWKPPSGSETNSLVWVENKLWFLQSKRDSDGKLTGIIRTIQPPAFDEGEVVDVPNIASKSPLSVSLRVTQSALYVICENEVQRYDRKTTKWSRFEFPEHPYTAILVRDMEVIRAYGRFSSSESGVLRWRVGNEELDVIASNRRRPALHEFDDRSAYSTKTLVNAPAGGIGLIIDVGYLYFHQLGTAEWSRPFRPGVCVAAFRTGNGSVLISRQAGIGLMDLNGKLTELPGSSFYPAQSKAPTVYLPEAFRPSHPRLANIDQLPEVAWMNGSLCTLRMRQLAGEQQTLVLSLADRVDKPADHFPDYPMQFVDSHEDPVKIERTIEISMLGTDQGLIFQIANRAGFWFLPKEDLETN